MTDWDRARALAQSGLAPALALVGRWEGDGIAHGEAVRGVLTVRAVLDATHIEVWERLEPLVAGGSVVAHEDVCFYRYDVASAQIRVLHLMAPAVVTEYAVEASMDGLVWVTPPNAPSVVWNLRGEALESEVYWPDQRVPEVRIAYRRVG